MSKRICVKTPDGNFKRIPRNEMVDGEKSVSKSTVKRFLKAETKIRKNYTFFGSALQAILGNNNNVAQITNNGRKTVINVLVRRQPNTSKLTEFVSGFPVLERENIMKQLRVGGTLERQYLSMCDPIRHRRLVNYKMR